MANWYDKYLTIYGKLFRATCYFEDNLVIKIYNKDDTEDYSFMLAEW